MPVIPSFRLSPDQLEKCSYKAAVVSEYCLSQINGILVELCDDQKASVPQSKAMPASEATESESLLDIDFSSEASTIDIFSASSPTLAPASPPVSSSASKKSSFAWGRKSSSTGSRIPAKVEEMVAPRCRMGDASIEGEFASIRYGTCNGRPACHIMVDFRLVFQPTSTINWAQIQFRFGSDAGTTGPQISKSFSPEELSGQYDTTQEIRAINPNIGLGVPGGKVTISGVSQQRACVKRRQWRVQGTREDHSGVYDTFCWKVIENEFSEDSVPRHFRTGMIVFLPQTSETDTQRKADFWVDVSVEGKLRGRRSRHKKVQERQWFEPTLSEQQSTNALDANALVDLVREQNKKIPDIVPVERILETGPVFPALPASAAASADVSAKPTPAHTQGQSSSSPQNSTTTSYEISEMQGIAAALSADELIALS